jgi:hypothetical protein
MFMDSVTVGRPVRRPRDALARPHCGNAACRSRISAPLASQRTAGDSRKPNDKRDAWCRYRRAPDRHRKPNGHRASRFRPGLRLESALSLRKSSQLGAKVIGILTVAEGASKPASLTAI